MSGLLVGAHLLCTSLFELIAVLVLLCLLPALRYPSDDELNKK
jgi:hypothetical protein